MVAGSVVEFFKRHVVFLIWRDGSALRVDFLHTASRRRNLLTSSSGFPFALSRESPGARNV